MPPKQCGRDDDDHGHGDQGGTCGGERNSRGHSREGGFAYRYDSAPGSAHQPGAAGIDVPTIFDDAVTVGVKRPLTCGTTGQPLTVTTNNFKITLPETIYHYIDIQLDEPKPIKWNHELIRALQERVAPAMFTPRAVYDGRKNLFAGCCLPLAGGNGNTEIFDVSLEPEHPGGIPHSTYKVTLKYVGEINPVINPA